MHLSDTQEEAIKSMVAAQLDKRPPRTQQEACDMAARIAVALGAIIPATSLRSHAAAGAEGFFGPAFEAAGDYQRKIWIDMYERALCKALDHI